MSVVITSRARRFWWLAGFGLLFPWIVIIACEIYFGQVAEIGIIWAPWYSCAVSDHGRGSAFAQFVGQIGVWGGIFNPKTRASFAALGHFVCSGGHGRFWHSCTSWVGQQGFSIQP